MSLSSGTAAGRSKRVGKTGTNAAVKGGVKKHRYLPGVRAEIELRRIQRGTGLLLPKLSFQRVLREVVQDISGMDDVRIRASAVEALQLASEDYLIELFSASTWQTMARQRATLEPIDMAMAANGDPRGPNMWTLQKLRRTLNEKLRKTADQQRRENRIKKKVQQEENEEDEPRTVLKQKPTLTNAAKKSKKKAPTKAPKKTPKTVPKKVPSKKKKKRSKKPVRRDPSAIPLAKVVESAAEVEEAEQLDSMEIDPSPPADTPSILVSLPLASPLATPGDVQATTEAVRESPLQTSPLASDEVETPDVDAEEEDTVPPSGRTSPGGSSENVMKRAYTSLFG